MKKYFVFFDDDHPESGGVGLIYFDEIVSAVQFIEERLGQDEARDLSCYQIISGEKMHLDVVETVTKIKATLE